MKKTFMSDFNHSYIKVRRAIDKVSGIDMPGIKLFGRFFHKLQKVLAKSRNANYRIES